jgi:hypothetical protein
MILKVPTSIVNFFRDLVPSGEKYAPDHIRRALPAIVAGVVFTTSRRRSMTAIGGAVHAARRDKATVSRLLTRRDFRSRDIHWEVVDRVFKKLAPTIKRGKRDWLLALDGTATKRGSETKIKGAIQTEKATTRKKRKAGSSRTRSDGKSKKGRKTKYHTFLLASLTTHTGTRVPLPRHTCDPKDYKRVGKPKNRRDTQLDLGKNLLKRVLEIKPEGVRLVVVADSYFECAKLYAFAKQNPEDLVLITPTDSDRCFADETTPSKSNGKRIQDRELSFSDKDFSRLDLRRGSEKTVRYRRYSARKPTSKDRRTYWLRHEARTVAGLGTVGIVYSWKTPVYEPRRNHRRLSFKILFCSDPTWSAERIVEWYECRWTAIEILIRELKQQLGFADHTGQNLDALERHIDVVLLSFLYLEMERARLLEDPGERPAGAAKAAASRTYGMQEVVRQEASRELIETMKQSHHSERKRRLLNSFFEHLTGTHDAGLASAYA